MSQITTHILDISTGRPASGVTVTLFEESGNRTEPLASAVTDSDGRVGDWLGEQVLPGGSYRLVFQTGQYFSDQKIETFYPHVEIVFQITDEGQHYHVPLLLSPFGYSTYRGS